MTASAEALKTHSGRASIHLAQYLATALGQKHSLPTTGGLFYGLLLMPGTGLDLFSCDLGAIQDTETTESKWIFLLSRPLPAASLVARMLAKVRQFSACFVFPFSRGNLSWAGWSLPMKSNNCQPGPIFRHVTGGEPRNNAEAVWGGRN